MMKPAPLPDTASAKAAIEPRIEKLGSLTMVGLARRQSLANTQEIPGQWQQFMTHYESIENKVEPIPVSVTTDMDSDGNFSYLTGVVVSSAGAPPKGLVAPSVPAQTYAAFTHSGHVSEIGKTYAGPMGAAKRKGRLRRTVARKASADVQSANRSRRHRDMDTGDVN